MTDYICTPLIYENVSCCASTWECSPLANCKRCSSSLNKMAGHRPTFIIDNIINLTFSSSPTLLGGQLQNTRSYPSPNFGTWYAKSWMACSTAFSSAMIAAPAAARLVTHLRNWIFVVRQEVTHPRDASLRICLLGKHTGIFVRFETCNDVKVVQMGA